MIYVKIPGVWSLYATFFLFGLTNSGVGLAYAVSTELAPPAVIGTSIAFTNMASIFVGASLQPLVGHCIDKIAGARSFDVSSLTLSDFQGPLALLIICSGMALVLSLIITETNCKKQH